MAFQISKGSQWEKDKSSLMIWAGVACAHLALMALIASKAIPQQSPSLHKSGFIKVKTIALHSPKTASELGQEEKKMQKNPPANSLLAKPLEKKRASDEVKPPHQVKSPLQERAPMPTEPLSKIRPDKRASQSPLPSSQKNSAAPKGPILTAKKAAMANAKAPNPAAARSTFDQKRAEAQKKALALISNIGNEKVRIRSKAVNSTSSEENLGTLISDEQDSDYKAQLIAVLQSNLQLPKCAEVKLKLAIGDDGSYLGHTIIDCKSPIVQHTIDCKLPELTFSPPLVGKQPSACSFILNLKCQ